MGIYHLHVCNHRMCALKDAQAKIDRLTDCLVELTHNQPVLRLYSKLTYCPFLSNLEYLAKLRWYSGSFEKHTDTFYKRHAWQQYNLNQIFVPRYHVTIYWHLSSDCHILAVKKALNQSIYNVDKCLTE